MGLRPHRCSLAWCWSAAGDISFCNCPPWCPDKVTAERCLPLRYNLPFSHALKSWGLRGGEILGLELKDHHLRVKVVIFHAQL